MKERYKINIIPCNSGHFGKKPPVKSRSVDDTEVDQSDQLPTLSPENPMDQSSNTTIVIPKDEGGRPLTTNPHLAMIAFRARTVERKTKKTRSYIDVKIGADSFISEKAGKFSDYYRILSRIGEGGYGQVFKVQHKKTGLIRAMKMIGKSKIDKKNQGKLFFEYQLLKNIDHPHIIRIYEVYNDTKNFYLITEFCEGGDIFSIIQRQEEFSEKIAARLMKQVVNAVLYCHLNGIVHRDIKADNVLLLHNDINSPVKLIDFGISVKFEKDTKLRDKTGTVLYIAPEVIQGAYDEKCDIWSLGVLMYMMLSGLPPFYGTSRKEVMAKIKKGKFSFKSKNWDRISKEAKDLIEKMLTYNPEQRPSCREVLNHPWFLREEVGKINTEVYLENMKRYENQSQLVQAILTFIVTNITQHEETRELEGLFKRLDTNQDGRLSKEELVDGYKQIYVHLDSITISQMVDHIIANTDYNHSGQIDYTEYLVSAMHKDKLITRDKLQKVFNAFDLV